MSREPAFPEGVITVPPNTVQFEDYPGRGSFLYTVQAFNDTGASDAAGSNKVVLRAGRPRMHGPIAPATTVESSATTALSVPSVPSRLRVNVEGTAVRLEWRDRSDNEDYFEISREQSLDSQWRNASALRADRNATTYRDEPASGVYRYHVRAGNAGGTSDFTGWVIVQVSASQSVPPANQPPMAPSAPAASDIGSGRAMFTWTDRSSNETGFILERAPAFASGSLTLGANTTSFIDQCGNGTFSYRVCAAGDAGRSAFTNWAQAAITSAAGSGSTGGAGSGVPGTAAGSDPGTCGNGGMGPTTPDGWSIITPAGNARVIYVSSSLGADSNDGLTDARPKRTLAGGYTSLRNGFGDWLLLRCGDTWSESFPGWNKSGESANARMVIGSYGSGDRPLILTQTRDAWRSGPGSGRSYLAIVGLHFKADTWVGTGNGEPPVGVFMLGGGSDLLIEDCEFERYGNNIVVQGYGGVYRNLQIRRCILSDPLRTDSGNTNMYVENVDGLLLEENVITNLIANDNAGNLMSHNVYIQETCARNSAVVRGNILYNARTNLTVRCGGLVENNLIIRGGQALQIGYIDWPVVPAVIRGNVVTESRNHWNGQQLGIGLVFDSADGVDCGYNIVTHATDGDYHQAVAVNRLNRQIDFHDNIFHDWQKSTGDAICVFVDANSPGPITVRNNILQQPIRGMLVWHEGIPASISYSGNREFANEGMPFFDGTGLRTFAQWRSANEPTAIGTQATFPDSGRTVGSYNGLRGGAASTEAFIIAARRQSRASWRPTYTAAAVNDYVRQGFGMAWPQP